MGAFSGRTALVTGASRGIGYEIARALAAEGAHLVLVARGTHDLEEATRRITGEYPVAATVMPADLGTPASIDDFVRRLGELEPPVDILVNNAGIGSYGPFHENDPAHEARMVDLNVVAVTRLARAVAPGMVARRWGRILNVASTAAFLGVPYMATYSATKAYVLALSEALHEELRPHGVLVTCLAPGTTDTGFFIGTGAHMKRRAPGTMSPGAVARAGVRGLARGKLLVVPGLHNRAMGCFVRLAPRGLIGRLAAFTMRATHGG